VLRSTVQLSPTLATQSNDDLRLFWLRRHREKSAVSVCDCCLLKEQSCSCESVLWKAVNFTACQWPSCTRSCTPSLSKMCNSVFLRGFCGHDLCRSRQGTPTESLQPATTKARICYEEFSDFWKSVAVCGRSPFGRRAFETDCTWPPYLGSRFIGEKSDGCFLCESVRYSLKVLMWWQERTLHLPPRKSIGASHVLVANTVLGFHTVHLTLLWRQCALFPDHCRDILIILVAVWSPVYHSYIALSALHLPSCPNFE
jgi:hypothetical protein